MVNPKVSPPNPHITPQNQHQNSVWCGTPASTPIRSGVRAKAMTHGAISQLNRPPASQNTSHDHSRMRL